MNEPRILPFVNHRPYLGCCIGNHTSNIGDDGEGVVKRIFELLPLLMSALHGVQLLQHVLRLQILVVIFTWGHLGKLIYPLFHLLPNLGDLFVKSIVRPERDSIARYHNRHCQFLLCMYLQVEEEIKTQGSDGQSLQKEYSSGDTNLLSSALSSHGFVYSPWIGSHGPI